MVDITTRKQFRAVDEACIDYVLTDSRLKRENICQLLVLNRGDLNFCVRVRLISADSSTVAPTGFPSCHRPCCYCNK